MKNAEHEMRAVVDFLEGAAAAALEVRRLRRRLEGLDERRGKLRIQKGASARKIEKMIAAEREREARLVSEELAAYRCVEEFIARVPQRAQRTILRRRYLDIGRSWDEIQSDLARDGILYSPRHLQRLHTQALRSALKLWNEEGR